MKPYQVGMGMGMVMGDKAFHHITSSLYQSVIFFRFILFFVHDIILFCGVPWFDGCWNCDNCRGEWFFLEDIPIIGLFCFYLRSLSLYLFFVSFVLFGYPL
ncbi:hypothetical protein F5X96DRAFT_63000 [Biscogniauxia mediterranea]|nr:hypothetical protein F5X96DRAFT_63000 [Biscogniauxia mediterranea]